MGQSFGLNQVNVTTPIWAKWIFRIVFLLTKIVVAYIAATNLISPESKYEITVFLTLVIDPVAYGLSKMFGISIDEDKPEIQTFDEPIKGGGGKNDPPPTP